MLVIGTHSSISALTGQIPSVQPETGSVISASFSYTATLSSSPLVQVYLKLCQKHHFYTEFLISTHLKFILNFINIAILRI